MSAEGAPREGLGRRLLAGLRISLAVQVVILAVNIVATPVIVRHVGADGYALYTLMWTLMNYLTLFACGTNLAASTYTARHGLRSGSPLGDLMRGTLAFQMGMAVLGGAVLFLSRGWIAAHLIQNSRTALEMAPRVFACVAVTVPFYFVLTLSYNILFGQQKFNSSSLLMLFQSASVAVVAAGLLHFGAGGLREIAASFFWAYAALAVVGLLLVRKVLAARSRRPTRKEVKEYAAFSFQSQLSSLVMLLISQGDRLFVAALMPLAQAGYYVISSSLAQKCNLLAVSVASVSFPMMAELHGTGEEKRLRRFYLKTTELTFFINLPLTILAFVLVPQFMTLWLGPAFSAASTWPFRLLLVGSTASLFSVMPNNLATGKGHPHLYAVFQGAKALLVMALWPSLIGRWGITGAAAGILAGEALTTPVFLGYIHARFLGVRWGEFWLNVCLRPLTAALGLAALGLATHAYVGTWFGMFAFAAAGMAGYFLIGYRLLDADAQSMLKEWAASRLQFRWR